MPEAEEEGNDDVTAVEQQQGERMSRKRKAEDNDEDDNAEEQERDEEAGGAAASGLEAVVIPGVEGVNGTQEGNDVDVSTNAASATAVAADTSSAAATTGDVSEPAVDALGDSAAAAAEEDVVDMQDATMEHSQKNDDIVAQGNEDGQPSVDQEEGTAGAMSDRPKNGYDDIKWVLVRNDGKPDSMIKLIGLKSLFSKQLPKMPKAYIARLVLDPRHTSLAIVSDNPAVKDSDEEIIGGICYRAFEDMRFAEIAFCAVNANHQVKGYGTKLMNLLKNIGARTGIEYFITYADNYAIGYFRKQGFTKSISMPKGRYFGLIKEYDGGTPMECYVHPSIDFTRIPEMLQAQRQFILSHVKRTAKSHTTVYPPLPKNFSPNLEGISRANHVAARAMAIPGMVEAGWTLADLIAATGVGKESERQRGAAKSDFLSIVRKIQEQHFSWPFREPVDTVAVPDYADVIKEPIDLSTIEKRIRQDNHYKSKQMLYADLMLMVNNCKLYNDEASTYVQCAMNLEKMLANLFPDVVVGNKG